MTTSESLLFSLILAATLLLPEPGCAPAPAPGMYFYRAINDDCNCQEYRLADRAGHVEYLFRARYRMEGGIVTDIEIELTNNSPDSLLFDHGAVKVSSQNVAYQYNDRFLPLPAMTIPPHRHDIVKLVGREINGKEDWNKIAGEQLRITIKGIQAGQRTLASQTAIFVPENPKLRR
jgi:hypothetical protein